MSKYLALALFLSTAAYAQYHSHVWTKQNEVRGRDSFGNAVVICSWSCYDGHFTQTQGFGYCPMPGP